MSRVLPQRTSEAPSYLGDDDSSIVSSNSYAASRSTTKQRRAGRHPNGSDPRAQVEFDTLADEPLLDDEPLADGTRVDEQRRGGAPALAPVEPVDLAEIPYVTSSPVYASLKRIMDVCGAIVGLTMFGPLMAVCAILIKWQDGGPVLFCQSRVGERGDEFSILKFRSMVVNADKIRDELAELNTHSDDRTFKILNDPRITPVGRLMRRLSLDELPQFWNVLMGDMSLVGPRPALPSEVAIYERRDLIRLSVRPGLTCIWQVSGRSKLDFTRQRQLDAEYIRRRSLWLDTLLILKTAPAVFRGDGAA